MNEDQPIGIGTPLAGRPSHTTVRTDRVYGGSAESGRSYPRSDKPSVCVK
jgi:hypothetical protein